MLTPEDLKKIGEIVQASEARLRGEITVAKEEVIERVNREVHDLAEINQVVIDKVSVVDDHGQRLTRVEDHLNLTPAKH